MIIIKIMLTQSDIQKLVRSFLHEACGYLGYDDSKVTIAYGPMPVPTMMVLLLKGADAIVIDTNILAKVAEKNQYTILRMDVYRVARQMYQRKMQGAEPDENAQKNSVDAYAFAYALCFLLGMSMAIPPLPEADDIKVRITEILNEEFHEDCSLHPFPSRQLKGELEYRGKKTQAAYKQIVADLKVLKPKIAADDVKDGELGSQSNPFENINDACDFILAEEQKAYEKDLYLSQTLANRRFNYLPDKNIYNIAWADGKCAYCHPEIPRDGFIVNQLQSGKFSVKPSLYGHKFLYRGQKKFYERCAPGLFRDPEQDYFLKELIQYDEFRAIVETHPLVQLFEKGIDLWHDMFRFEVNYGGLAQHYYNKTAFLDLTSDIEAAKFFAVTDYCNKEDKYTAHHGSGIGVMYYYELAEPDAFQYKRTHHLSTIGKQIFMRSGNQHGFLLRMEKDVNFNNLPEVHKVFFKHDDEISDRIFSESRNGQKYFPWDGLQEMWKRNMERFAADSTVSLRAVELNAQDNIMHHETVHSITKKLQKKPYSIKVDKDRKPCFDPDILDRYYEDIKNGWWQDIFCKDIYFASSDGIVYKDLLMKLPENPDYKQYFYR